MTWLALLLIGIGVTDLAFSVRPTRTVPACLGAGVALLGGLLLGLTRTADVVALVVVAAVVVGWGATVTWGSGPRGRPWVPLALLGTSLVVAVLVSPAAGDVSPGVARWLADVPLPAVAGVDPETALLVLGVLLAQLSTGNVVVRLVLSATGTVNPAEHGSGQDPETRLKGGRLLGPMERVFIVGLGLAGHLTAASIVIAAKGLLRFPELQSRAEQDRIHQLTEYFLVGSFLSWLVALGSLALVG